MFNMITKIQEKIIDEFSSRVTQGAYIKNAEKGLWTSEKILIAKYFKPNSNILDIGCGTGRTTIPLYELGYKITGLDLTPLMIENAKKIAQAKNLEIFYEVGDATKLKYPDNSFDNVIFSNNGWTQIPGGENRFQALKEIYRVLKPDGYFIFTAHVRTRRNFKWFWLRQWLKFYILKPLGFKIEEIEFGDRFFAREINGAKFEQKQFIHIANANKIKNQIVKVGFKLALMDKENKIVKTNLHDNDNVHNHSPIFYVCRK